MGCVYGVSAYAMAKGGTPSINVAVLGLTVGEFLSMLIAILSIYICYAREHLNGRGLTTPSHGEAAGYTGLLSHLHGTMPIYHSLFSMALPLTANRIVLNLLQSVESVSLPAKLRLYGYDTATALSVYGVLTGMAMPLIFFPNALTSSIAVLLLPLISESYALRDMATVRRSTLRTIKYCLLLGACCMLGFVLLGDWAGTRLFDSALAGHFITTLGFICPFMYLDTTLSSILQGLGMAGHIFLSNALCLLVRLFFVFIIVPHTGITGYLWGILVSQLLLSLLYLLCLRRFFQKH